MRLALTTVVVAVALSLGVALAAQTTTLDCIKMPACCEFNCIMMDVDFCGCTTGPLTVEFLACDGAVLGTTTLAKGDCDEYWTGSLDKTVNSNDVYSIRLTNADDASTITWAAIWVNCMQCDCGKWKKVFKGNIWCWEPVAAPAPEPMAAMPPEPPAPVYNPPPAPPAPMPELKREPPKMEEPKKEVIEVEGRG